MSYHDFINKVALAYGITETGETKNSLTVNHIFEMALSEKKDTENNSSNTLVRLQYDFDRFIDSSLRKRRITEID